MRAACLDNKNALEAIEKAENFHQQETRKFYKPGLAPILRGRSPTPGEELIATILSENPETISEFMNTLPQEARAEFRLHALMAIKEVLDSGYTDPRIEEKVIALD